MMFDSSCAILMRALLRLSLHVEIPITNSNSLMKPALMRVFLRTLVNHLMIALLDLSQL
jgi:hypothetical protein